MAVIPIETDVGSVFYDAPSASVAVAATLAGPFVVQPRLRCDRLRITAAPEIDQAELRLDYGNQLVEDGTTFAPVAAADLLDKFVRVTIPEAAGTGQDLVWYGLVEADDRQADGSDPVAATPSGTQFVTAYGLLRLFERTGVTTAVIRQGTDQILTIGRGLSFNRDQQGRFLEHSNRSIVEHDAGDDGVAYVFTEEPSGLLSWSAWDAVEHLLVFHPPRDAAGSRIADVVLSGDEASLSWYEFGLDTDGRTVKELLDALIDRRRGVGYKVTFTEAGGSGSGGGTPGTLAVEVFTFAAAPVALPSGATLAENPNQYSLNFEQAYDVEQAIVSNLAISRYDRVVVRGQPKTSTLTLRFTFPEDPLPQLVPAWDVDEEDAYLEAASGLPGYAELELTERCKLNALARAADAVAPVFSRFVIAPEWNGRVDDVAGVGPDFYWAAPVVDENGDPLKTLSETVESEPFWQRGLRIERFLPLRDRRDYSGTRIEDFTFGDGFFDYGEPEYLRPFCFVEAVDPASSGSGGDVRYWTTIERLAASAGDEREGRKWAATLRLLDAGPQLQIDVHGGPQHMLAPDEMALVEGSGSASGSDSGAVGVSGDGYVGVYDPEDDPALYGIPWQQLYATLCLRLDSRVEAQAAIGSPPAGRPERVLTIEYADARLDYVVPYTVVGLSRGELVQTTSGGFVRDDRGLLADIARASAEWYGRERQALRMRFKQVRRLVEPGDLIVDVGANYNRTGVNTVVTAVTYDLLNVSTEFETSYAALDVT